MQAVHVDIHRVRFHHTARDIVAAERGHRAKDFGGVDPADGFDQGAALFGGTVERIELVCAADEHSAARGQDRMVGETGRRVHEEASAARGQAPDGGVAVGFAIDGGRTPRGVVAGLAFALQNNHRPVRR